MVRLGYAVAVDGSVPNAVDPTDPVFARLRRVRDQIAALNRRVHESQSGFRAPTRPGPASNEANDEIARLREHAELMQAWAQDSEGRLAAAQQQLREAVQATALHQQDAKELRQALQEQQALLRTRDSECQELSARLFERSQAQDQMRQQIAELERSLANVRETVVEQGELLRETESREARLRRRLKESRHA